MTITPFKTTTPDPKLRVASDKRRRLDVLQIKGGGLDMLPFATVVTNA